MRGKDISLEMTFESELVCVIGTGSAVGGFLCMYIWTEFTVYVWGCFNQSQNYSIQFKTRAAQQKEVASVEILSPPLNLQTSVFTVARQVVF